MGRLASHLRHWFVSSCSSFSFVGLAVATLFFAASMTPSLLPRHYAVQGVLSGFALAAGYGVGVLLVWTWQFLELPRPSERLDRVSKQATAAVVAAVVGWFMWRETIWQNSIRQLMEMEPVETGYPWRVTGIAIVAGVVLVAIARGLRKLWRLFDRWINRVVPRRISQMASAVLVVVLVLLVVNDVIARLALNAADAAFLQLDKVIDDGVEQPAEPTATGSDESLVEWDAIGRRGKNFLVTGPTQQAISEFWGRDVRRPLRVYVGMNSRETPEERAELALEELKRTGGFERSVLIVATPTGTGWLDPGAVDTVEYLHAGDTAIVSMQYSYLPSWITILVDPLRSRASAQALFDAIYGHWTTLPKDNRPRLYLHGLSLGSLGSEMSADLIAIFEDPIHGAVWSGPPFPSMVWGRITRDRNPDSPQWLPTFRDGSMVRFTAQSNSLDQRGKRWGPMRLAYIQYASDPMIFFAPDLMYRKPDWLVGQRGPDVSPYLRWFPIVTFLQTAFDLPMATSIPIGYGHNYAPANYIDAWIAVTNPPDWTPEQTERLKKQFAPETR